MNTEQRTAAWLAVLPMTTGFAILGLFAVTGWWELTMAGLIVMFLGLFMTGGASIAVAAGWVTARRDGQPLRRRSAITVCVVLLIVSNYPLAGACFLVGETLALARIGNRAPDAGR